MKYLYIINSSFDGFTPEKIPKRLINDHLIYNWREYFDNIEKKDEVFTYFYGTGVRRGIYLISRVVEIRRDKRVVGKVLFYSDNEPLIPSNEFESYKSRIINRPRGTIYAIPPSLHLKFDRFKRETTISEIEIDEEEDCHFCNQHKCENCDLFKPRYLIKWDNEVDLTIPNILEFTSPYWVFPRQSHIIKVPINDHPFSRMFYYFKSGYECYSMLFGNGIINALKMHSRLRKIRFDYIIGIPLSPNKIKNKELDRVAELCKVCSKKLKIDFLPEALSLTKSISRRSYKMSSKSVHDFVSDYSKFLQLNVPDLDCKLILLIDDVITDGKTLNTTAELIQATYPKAQIYAASGGIMAKKRNLSFDAYKKLCY
ncbi:hypothetical protein ES703_13454 [subsurface metagenome]